MTITQWFKERQIDAQGIRADAEHMQERYGESALDMCEYAILSARDGTLKHKLKLVRRLLQRSARLGPDQGPEQTLAVRPITRSTQ